MAVDVLDANWDAATKTLRGRSAVVGEDPYELRVFVPEGFELAGAKVEGLVVTMGDDGPLVLVRFTAPADHDVAWAVQFE